MFDSRKKMASLADYTHNIPLTQKAKFWTNYVSALKGDLDNLNVIFVSQVFF